MCVCVCVFGPYFLILVLYPCLFGNHLAEEVSCLALQTFIIFYLVANPEDRFSRDEVQKVGKKQICHLFF